MIAPLRDVHIVGTGSYTPDRVLTNADLERIVDTSDEWITSRTGIKERRISDPGTPSSALATEAARRALDAAGLTGADLDQIIVGTVTGDRTFPSTACILQDRLGADRAHAFDISAACAGFVYGLSVGKSSIESGMARRAAERFERMSRCRPQVEIQIRVCFERLGRVLIGLLIDSQMTCRATVDSWNRLERLIIVKIAKNDLVDALRRIHEVEYRRVPERNDDGARIQRVESRS